MVVKEQDRQKVNISSKRQNILFVIGSLEIGGAERQMATLIKRIHNRTYFCHVFSLQLDGILKADLADVGVPVYSGGLKKGDLSRAPWKLISAQWKLIRTIQQLKPIIVHSFLPLVTFMGALAGRLSQVPLVITSRRALGTHQERFAILRHLDLMANFLSHSVTVNSKAVLSDVIKRDRARPDKLVLIYNGINSVPFEVASRIRDKLRGEMGLTGSDKVIIVVANLIPYKGHFDFLKAARLVSDHIPTALFWLVGDDRGILNDLEHVSSILGIHKKVRFMGQRCDIDSLLAVSNLAVLPSHEEGFSNVILESMAAGLPVVATSVGGNPEAVVDGVTGWLVPPRNPAVMAEKIVDLLGNPRRAISWGERGRRRVKELFSVEKMVESHVRLYEGRGTN